MFKKLTNLSVMKILSVTSENHVLKGKLWKTFEASSIVLYKNMFLVWTFSKRGGGRALLFTIFQFFIYFIQDGRHAKYGWPRYIYSQILCYFSVLMQCMTKQMICIFSPLSKQVSTFKSSEMYMCSILFISQTSQLR